MPFRPIAGRGTTQPGDFSRPDEELWPDDQRTCQYDHSRSDAGSRTPDHGCRQEYNGSLNIIPRALYVNTDFDNSNADIYTDEDRLVAHLNACRVRWRPSSPATGE
jgi:hypothetical protein